MVDSPSVAVIVVRAWNESPRDSTSFRAKLVFSPDVVAHAPEIVVHSASPEDATAHVATWLAVIAGRRDAGESS
jgi:hypothetical protein